MYESCSLTVSQGDFSDSTCRVCWWKLHAGLEVHRLSLQTVKASLPSASSDRSHTLAMFQLQTYILTKCCLTYFILLRIMDTF